MSGERASMLRLYVHGRVKNPPCYSIVQNEKFPFGLACNVTRT
jgi:hypothetical protein